VIAAHDIAIGICELGLTRSQALEKLNDLFDDVATMVEDEYDTAEHIETSIEPR
jgi:hypothetical protein